MIVAKKNSKFYYYFNLASPFIYEEETIKYIDFDLDFRINDARIDRMTELDINEFNENKILYKYPQKLIDKIKQAETEIKERFKNGDFKKYLDMDLLYLVK
jgi:protein associated with RNAse G/E